MRWLGVKSKSFGLARRRKRKCFLTSSGVIDGENDWNKIQIASKEEWNILKTRLQATQNQLWHVLSSESDQLLQQRVPCKDYNFGPILTSIAQHDIYHLGQIAMLNAMR